MTLAQQLEQLDNLRASGSLSEAEFQNAKEKLLSSDAKPLHKIAGTIHGIEERTYCTLMHISQLLIWSGVGILVPILMWVLGKDQSELVHQHGNRMMNWLISSFIYGVVSALLVIFLIGVPMAIVLCILSVVFPILAALKANDGHLWSYPLTIKFLQED